MGDALPVLLGRRGLLFALSALALGWGLRHGRPEVAAFGFALVGVIALSNLYARLLARGLETTRDLYPRAFEDQVVSVRFLFTNRSPLPAVLTTLVDYFPADKTSLKQALVYPWAPARSAIGVAYEADCFAKRGLYTVGPVEAEVADPLGLFPRRVALGQTAELLVFPQTFGVARMPEGRRGAVFDLGSLLARRAGTSLEFLGIREHRPGDPLRAIHWPAVARRGRLVIKEFERESVSEVSIFLDLARMSLKGLGRVSTLEYGVRIAASLAAYYVQRGDRVQLHAQGREPLLVPARAGETHLAELLETLALVRPDGERPLHQVLEERAPGLPAPSIAVIIFAAARVELARYVDSLTLLRRKGIELVCVILDDETFLPIFKEQAPGRERAAEIADVASALLAEGATVYVAAKQDDLARRLEEPLLARAPA